MKLLWSRCRRCTGPCPFEQHYEVSSEDFTELFDEVRALVQRCLDHQDVFFVIEAQGRYVQALAKQDRPLWVESVSNRSLAGSSEEGRLSSAEELRMTELGWLPPDERSPNWYRVFDDEWPQPAPLVSELLVRTLADVHRGPVHALEVELSLTAFPT
jgi:hypothetical protein